ncbi:MAG: DUF4760 domain-containing protein [Lachnospiraceae bacterium]|jgi:hypothetical protein|nr:DUF4760 domain-containing protein [Lachnospiraceae bacterium]
MNLSCWLDWSTLVANIAICLGIIIAAFQLRQMKKSIKADHDRRRKQSTIEFFQMIHMDSDGFLNDSFFKIKNPITDNDKDKKKITVEMIMEKKHEKLKKQTMDFLTGFENLAIGVNSGMYDFDVCYHLCGEHMILIYESLDEIIWHLRREIKSSDTFVDSEIMIEKMRKKREERHIDRLEARRYDYSKIKKWLRKFK